MQARFSDISGNSGAAASLDTAGDDAAMSEPHTRQHADDLDDDPDTLHPALVPPSPVPASPQEQEQKAGRASIVPGDPGSQHPALSRERMSCLPSHPHMPMYGVPEAPIREEPSPGAQSPAVSSPRGALRALGAANLDDDVSGSRLESGGPGVSQAHGHMIIT